MNGFKILGFYQLALMYILSKHINYQLFLMFNNKSSQKPGPILAVYYVRLLHAITCPFSKYFQILCIFVKISKCFALFGPFSEKEKKKNHTHALTFQNRPCKLKKVTVCVSMYDLLLRKSIKGLKIFLHKIQY